MRALLIANPVATTTTARTRDVLLHALAADLDLEVAETTHRGHALELAREAATSGVELVITLGGDGTVNEAVNGLLDRGPGPDRPALAVVPGGSTNVFSRALGVGSDPVEATGQILDALRERRTRSIGLSTADGRWFTFCAGLGLDAEVVAAVERARSGGRRSTPALYLTSAVREFYAGDRDAPALRLTRPGEEPVEGLHLAIVQNTAPWTYLGGRAVNPSPQASFDTGLDLLALHGLGTASTLRHVRQLLLGRRPPHGRDVVALHDVPELTLWADRPTSHQVDGDHLGDRMSVTFRAHPDALRVVL
ncbi:MAG TPA: diacylglycerol kinase family protein [Candidatus Limnocylindria bacterium]|nr:diacylglycerol kinase family protein [Candidatus Limnocylindria bacterium]